MKRHLETYRFRFAQPDFATLNRQMVLMGLKGRGMLNIKNADAGGERSFDPQLLAGEPRLVCLDVDTSDGDHSQMLLKVQTLAQAHAFEPHPLTFARSAARHAGRRDIHRRNIGHGAEPGELELLECAQGDGSSHTSVHCGVIEALRGRQSTTRRMPAMRVDANGVTAVERLKVNAAVYTFQNIVGVLREPGLA